MFVENDMGRKVKVRSASDLSKIQKDVVKVYDNNGKVLCKSINKATLIKKLR